MISRMFQVFNKLIKAIKAKYDSIFVLILLFLFVVDCTTICFGIIAPNSKSIPLILIVFFLVLWFAIRLIDILIKKRKKEICIMNKNNIALLLLLLIITFSIINVLLSTFLETKSLIFSFNYYKKIILFNCSIIFYYLSSTIKKDKNLNSLIFSILIIFSLVLLFSFISGLGKKFSLYDYNGLTLNFSNPNFASMVLVTTIFCLVPFLFIYKNICIKILLFGVIFGLLILTYFTSSRNGLLAVGCVICLIILITIFKFNFIKKRIVLSIILFLPLIAAASYFIIYKISHGELIYTGEYNFKDFGSRFGIWKTGFSLFGRNPIFGSYYIASDIKGSGEFQYHNSLLDILVAYGLLPTLLTIFLFYYSLCEFSFNNVLTIGRKISFVSMFGIWILGIFEAAYFNPGLGMFVLFFIPIVVMQYPSDKNKVLEKYALNNVELKKQERPILLINSVYETGSTGKIVKSLYSKNIKNNKTCYVLYGRGLEVNDLDCCLISNIFFIRISQVFSKIFKNPYGFNYINTLKIINQIKILNPKVVHIHNLNDHYVNIFLLLKFLGKKHIKTIITHHSEYFYIGNCGGHAMDCTAWIKNACHNCYLAKSKFSKFMANKSYTNMVKAFKNFRNSDLINVCVSPWLLSRLNKSNFMCRFKNICIYNGIEFDKNNLIELNKKINRDNTLLFVTPSLTDKNKGYEYFKILQNQLQNDYKFKVISYEKPEEKLANVTYLSIKNQSDLFNEYSKCFATLILSKRETFSMPVAESLICGTPVFGFKSGGPESISIGSYSLFVDYGDCESLIEELLNKKSNSYNSSEIMNAAFELFGVEKMYKCYNILYSESDINFEISI